MATETTEPSAEASGLPITPDAPIDAPAEGHQPFRFAAASTFSSTRQETLEAWHRPFLRIASAALRTLIRLDVDLEIDSVQVQTCGQLIAERGEQNQAVLFRMAPQPDLWLLDLQLPLALLAVERMMGGTSAKLAETDNARELTDLEQIIFQQFASTLLGDYARNWLPHAEYKAEIVRSTRHIRLPRTIGHQPDDLLVRIGLQAVLKDGKSPLSILLPLAVVDELLQNLGESEDQRATAETTASIRDKNSPIASVPVPVSVRWEGFQITLHEVESLTPGDLLVLDSKKCEAGVVWLGGRPRYAGKVTREAQKTLVTLTHPLE